MKKLLTLLIIIAFVGFFNIVYANPIGGGGVLGGGGGGSGEESEADIVTTSPLTVNGGANLDDALPGADADVTFNMPAATNATAGHATAAHIQAIEANTAKNTNVPTSLSAGTVSATTYGITSDGGANDIVLPEANTDNAGLLGADKWDEIVANTAKNTNVPTSLSTGTVGISTVAITSDGGADDVTIPAATNAAAGVATAAQIIALEAIDTEAELEALLELQDLQGAVTDAQVPNDITITNSPITIKRYYPATLSDTSSPHALTIAECSNTLITTQGWNGTDNIEFDLPDISAYTGSEGVLIVRFRDTKGMQDADTDFYIDPGASTQIVLNGTPTGTDSDSIWNDNTSIYDGIICMSDYDPTLAGYWLCDTIIGAWTDKGGDAP